MTDTSRIAEGGLQRGMAEAATQRQESEPHLNEEIFQKCQAFLAKYFEDKAAPDTQIAYHTMYEMYSAMPRGEAIAILNTSTQLNWRDCEHSFAALLDVLHNSAETTKET